jgi:serine phosphatase RsbU (regulator of sigma subunit)
MVLQKTYISVFLFLIVFFYGFYAQCQIGQPFIRNYSPVEYKGSLQTWSVIQDKRGVIYVSGNDHILQYDGVKWKKTFIASNAAVRAMDIDENGKVYVGAIGDFGYLEPNNIGEFEYVSLSKRYLDSTNLEFSDIWVVAIHQKKVYFCSNNYLFIYDKTAKDKIKVQKNAYFMMFKTGNRLIVLTEEEGMHEVINDSLIPMPGGNDFWTMFVLPYDEDKYLVGNPSDGITIYNPNAKHPEKYVSFDDFDEKEIQKTNDYLRQKQVYAGAKLNDDFYALGTISDGIVIIDKLGKIIQVISTDDGLQNETVHGLYVDYQNQLWAALSYGVSRLELNSPISVFNETNNLKGSIYDVTRHNGILYVSTNLGLYAHINGKFKGVKNLYGSDATQVFGLKSIQINNKSILLASALNGIWQINKLDSKYINKSAPMSLHHYPQKKNYIYGIDDGYLISFALIENKWTKVDTLLFVGYNSFLGSLTSDEKLWLDIDDKPAYIDIAQSEYKIKKIEHDETLKVNKIVDYNESTLFLTNIGIYKHENGSTIPAQSEPMNYLKGTSVKQFMAVNDNEFWIQIDDDSFNKIIKLNVCKEGVVCDSISFNRIRNFEEFVSDGDSIMWILSAKELYKFDIRKEAIHSNKSSLIRRLQVGIDSIVFYGAFYNKVGSEKLLSTQQTHGFLTEIDYDQNNVEFEFAMPFYDNEKANQFKWKLDGEKRSKWSDWSYNTRKEYTNLSPGKYTFKVISKNIYGITSAESSYTFFVLSPWYMSWYAIIIYVLLGILLIIIIIKLYTRKLKADKKRLENIVTERTAEIMQQKEEILTQSEYLKEANTKINSQNKQLVYKNKQVTDSIQSASRIQTAMLPEKEIMNGLFPQHFIYFNPRDIVSGDFYWSREVINKYYFAVGDCTGHGVPGAMVSMLGISLLNEIVFKKAVKTAADVLETMRIEIKQNLKQTGKISDSREGIDMAFCIFDPKTYEINYAGAYNPLIIIRNGELIEHKAVRNPIGIHRFEKPFKNNYIQIERGDLLYLFSDGYIDQIGGAKAKKYKSANFKKLLLKISVKNIEDQKIILEDEMNNWKGDNEQIDDMLIIGIRF